MLVMVVFGLGRVSKGLEFGCILLDVDVGEAARSLALLAHFTQ